MKANSPYGDTTEPFHIQNGGHDAEPDEDPDTMCGIGSFRPRCLQVFARIGAFIGIYSSSGLLTSTLTVYVNSQVSMLEKQFGFSSAETGMLMSCNDIGYLTCVLFAGYLARKVHIPRGLAFSTVLFGICGVLCALPYFIQDKSMYDIEPQMSTTVGASKPRRVFAGRQVPMCAAGYGANGTEDSSCSQKNSTGVSNSAEQLWIKNTAYWLIAVGMVLQGIGKSPRYPFLTLYVDAVDKSKTGFYFGILIGTGIFGPALGYLLGGLFSKLYVTLEDVDITPSDPRWIGAWWLGFIVFGLLSIAFSVPLTCFPRKLRSKQERFDGELAKQEKQAEKNTDTPIVHEVKGFLSSMLRVLRTPFYTMVCLSTCTNLIGVSGALSFKPKYLASQYSIPLWKANIVMAVSNVTAVALGSFLGGIMSRKINMTPRTTILLMITLYVVSIAFSTSGFFLGCDQPNLVGDNGKGEMSHLYSSSDLKCVNGCTCYDEKYFPVCGDDGNSYFSPCHAGCSAKQAMVFSNCTCIPSGRARAGLCDQGCSNKLIAYACITFVGGVFHALKIIPGFLAVIRSVREKDRAVATAISGFLSSTIGWMPGPVIFGMVIDGTCTLWKYTCGERQSCQLYDIVHFRNAIHAYTITSASCATLIVTCIYIYLRVKDYTTWSQVSGEEMDNQSDRKFQSDIKDENEISPFSSKTTKSSEDNQR